MKYHLKDFFNSTKIKPRSSGFTLIELVLVIIILGVMFTVVARGTGTFAYWKEDAFFRHIREIMSFLHSQAIADQAYYRLEFNTETNKYRVGVLREEGNDQSSVIECSQDVGALSCDLAFFISPALPENYTLIPPPSYPSLFEPEALPYTLTLSDIKGGGKTPDTLTKTVDFTPQNSSSGALLYFKADRGSEFTITYNPFTGATELFRERKDFSDYVKKGES